MGGLDSLLIGESQHDLPTNHHAVFACARHVFARGLEARPRIGQVRFWSRSPFGTLQQAMSKGSEIIWQNPNQAHFDSTFL